MIIRGRVVDAEGRPVAGAQVWLDNSFAPTPVVGQTADPRNEALELPHLG